MLARGLTEAGFSTDVCDNGIDGLAAAVAKRYDAIILDLMMPKLDGWSLLAGLRANDKVTPTLILSARESVEDRVRGLNLGADDYLVKPFAFEELVARLRTLVKHGTPDAQEALAFEDLRLDPQRRSASRGGFPIDLSMKEYQVLEVLLQRQGETLSHATLSRLLWDMNVDSDSNVIEVIVRGLRRKIDDPFERRLIHTVKGRGYVIR